MTATLIAIGYLAAALCGCAVLGAAGVAIVRGPWPWDRRRKRDVVFDTIDKER